MELSTPGPTVGVVGGGQLGRMLGEAAGPLGVEVVALDPTPDPPAAPVVRDTVTAAFDDGDAVHELAGRADVLTYEIELADPDLLAAAGEATDTPVHPAPGTLRTTRDKLVETEAMAEFAPVPAYRSVGSAEEVRAAGEELGYPLMVKARRGGYDGRGNVPVEAPGEAGRALSEATGHEAGELPADAAMVEALLPFERELAVMGVRGADERAAFPVTETIHREQILRESVTPARCPASVREEAREVALSVLEALDGRGVFGIEMFHVEGVDPDRVAGAGADEGATVLVNEIAPRPHNSGHWTIEGARCSQFEQHLRAVLGWPLGGTDGEAAATANLLGDVEEPEPATMSGVDAVLGDSSAHLHWYGKREARPLRKMGHVTVVGEEPDATVERARRLRDATTFR
jgi:5-(carboxyamino)imidazole ribonucleotide synthase